MKHAALIIAHKNKEQLIRLIRKIACESIDVYVHLDSKWDLSKQDISDIANCVSNVTVIKKRISGELDKWSLPQIALDLALEALKNASIVEN